MCSLCSISKDSQQNVKQNDIQSTLYFSNKFVKIIRLLRKYKKIFSLICMLGIFEVEKKLN